MKRKTALLMFPVILASLFPLASFFIRNASCRLEKPIVNVYPSQVYVGLPVVVSANVTTSTVWPCDPVNDTWTGLTLPEEAYLVSGENPAYLDNIEEVDSREVNWTIVFTEAGTFDLEVNASGYYDGTFDVKMNESITITVLASPFEIDILSPENKTYATSSVPLTFTASESTSWIGYSSDGQANVTITGNTTLTSLPDGAHSTVVYANDTMGNMRASSTVYFTVDTTSPTISVLSPENKTYAVEDVPLTFTVNEATSWIGYSLDGQANVTISSNITLSGLSDGSHNLRVYAKDTAENTGASEIVTFSKLLDTTPPTVSVTINPTDPETTQTVAFTITAEDIGGRGIANITLYIDDAPAKTWTAAGTYTYNGGPYTEGTHTCYASACDSAGNNCRDPSSGYKTFTVSAPPQPLPLWQLSIAAVVLSLLGAGIFFAVRRRKKIA